MKTALRFVFFVSIIVLFFGCQRPGEILTVFHAGSLAVPLKEIVSRYQAQHPEVEVRLESAGSLTCIRKITELNKACDVLAVADYSLIDQLMIPAYADYAVLFAGNEMAIGYKKGSGWEKEITEWNWPEILTRDEVHFGRANPDHDPAGYRAVMVAALAERVYALPGFQQQLIEKDRQYIRPKATELLPLLEVGAIDFIFNYRSVLVQHNLGFLALPDSLNLSDPELDTWYAEACVEVDGNQQHQRIMKCGEAMVYGLCKPHTSKSHRADQLIQFILSQEGQEVFKKCGQPVIKPRLSENSIQSPPWFSSLKRELGYDL